MRHYYYYTFVDGKGLHGRIWSCNDEVFPFDDIYSFIEEEFGNAIITFWKEVDEKNALKHIAHHMKDMK